MGRHPAIRRPPLPAAAGRRSEARSRTPQDNVRAEAVAVVERTLASLAPVDTFLTGALGRLDERDHGLLRELVLGTLRWLSRLDDVIVRAAGRPLEAIDPALRTPLRVAVYQLLFLDRVPAHAVVDEAVTQAHRASHRGGAGFVNAVLRTVARSPRLADWPVEDPDPVRRLAREHAHPAWLVARWVERWGSDVATAVLTVDNRQKPFQLLTFRDRGGRELAAEQLIDQGLEVEPSGYSPLGLTVREGNPLATASFREGAIYLQDEVSQSVALLPPPRPGERILDAAAVPGGKALAALAYEPTVELVLADLAVDRLGRLRDNLRRLGRRLPVLAADAGQPALAPASFDRVVVDLPCSGTGTFRRHPELKWRLSPEEITRLARQGLRLLGASADLVRPGGLLVAITCSLEPEENEVVVGELLAQRRDLALVDLAPVVLPVHRLGIDGPGRWRALPAGDHDGFTAHVLQRQS
jgi:16S rRNA (cytosine967-C5)-methyltransferase